MARFNIRTQPSLYRDFALLSAFILFMLVLVSVWVAFETYNDHSDKIVTQLENEAVRIDRALIVRMENASYLLESLGRQISHSGSQDLSAISSIFTAFDKQGFLNNSVLSWANEDHFVVTSSNRGILDKPVDITDRDYIKKTISDPWHVKIGRPISGRVSENWVIPLAIGLTDKDDRYVGSVVISVDIDSLTNDINEEIRGSGISFAITSTSMTLLTQVSESRNFYSQYFDIEQLSQIDFAKDRNGVYSTASMFGKNDIFAYYEVSSQYPYVILLGYDHDLTQQAIQDILLPRLFQLVIIAVFLLFVLWTVRKRIIQPVIDLTDRTSELIRGGGAKSQLVSGPMEITHLAEEIQRLGDFLNETKRVENELRTKIAVLQSIKESAQVTNQVKAEFLESIAQELLQPISRIGEYATSLSGEFFGPLSSSYKNSAQEIGQLVEELDLMIDDIRAISEAETGLLALNEKPVNINFVLRKCVRLFAEKTAYGDRKIHLEVPHDIPALYADELRLKQIILNLLVGAASYTKPEDTVHVVVSMDNQNFRLEVHYIAGDMPQQETIQTRRSGGFRAAIDIARRQPQQGSDTKGMAQSGGGLGLALTRLLVALHQGELDVRTRKNRQTVITMILPKKRVLKNK